MKEPLNKRVPIAWLLLMLIVTAAIGILWMALRSGPPQNAVLITGEADIAVSKTAVGTQTSPDSASIVTQKTADVKPTSDLSAANRTISVYVSGAVDKPGVYTMTAGARVGDAINAAGGPQPDADMEQINLAAHVTDEEHISVLRKGDISAATAVQPSSRAAASPTVASAQRLAPAQSSPGTTGKVNLNTATSVILEGLPGVGPVLAARIIADREKNGPFKTIEDLKRVPGIKDAIFAKLHDLIYVGQ